MFPTAHKIPGLNLAFSPGGGKAQIQGTVWLAPDVGTHASLILASRGKGKAGDAAAAILVLAWSPESMAAFHVCVRPGYFSQLLCVL